jgi:cob(I)alamin adenosyltransferase
MFTVVGVVSWVARRASLAVPAVPVRTKIYTRTGDAGTSSLFTGERRSKEDIIFDCLGATDELSSHLGLVRAVLPSGLPLDLPAQLAEVQCRLQDLGSVIATPDLATRARASAD